LMPSVMTSVARAARLVLRAVSTSVRQLSKSSSIRGKDTKPEMVLRRALHARGFRYRLHGKGVPGRPSSCMDASGTVTKAAATRQRPRPAPSSGRRSSPPMSGAIVRPAVRCCQKDGGWQRYGNARCASLNRSSRPLRLSRNGFSLKPVRWKSAKRIPSDGQRRRRFGIVSSPAYKGSGT